MEIENVELVTDRPFPLENGDTKLPNPYFQVTFKDGTESRVPLDPTNRHYQEVAEWYDSQGKKPFEYDFER